MPVHSASPSAENAGALVADSTSAAWANENIDYTHTADATAVYACTTAATTTRRPPTRQTINAEVSVAGSFEPKNGRVQASLLAGPPSAGAFSCPNGEKLVLASVSYTNIDLTDTSNGVTASLAAASRTLVDPEAAFSQAAHIAGLPTTTGSPEASPANPDRNRRPRPTNQRVPHATVRVYHYGAISHRPTCAPSSYQPSQRSAGRGRSSPTRGEPEPSGTPLSSNSALCFWV